MTPINLPGKYLFLIHILFIFEFHTFAQSQEQVVKSYLELNKSVETLKLNHGPFTANFGTLEKAKIFFVVNNQENDEFKSHAVLYDEKTKSYTSFAYFTFDSYFGSDVISVFFENLDNHPMDELIVLYQLGTRTYYSAGAGPYAGMKVHYETRVFKCNTADGLPVISEYKAIGDLLTVNLPMTTGTFEEEELIGRESGADLENILGATYNASQIKKRITHLKKHGLLGGMSD